MTRSEAKMYDDNAIGTYKLKQLKARWSHFD